MRQKKKRKPVGFVYRLFGCIPIAYYSSIISTNSKRYVKHLHTLVNLQTFSKDQILKYIYFFTSNAKIVKQVPRQWGKSLYGEKSLVTQLRKNCFVNILCTLNFAQKYRLRNRGMYCLLLDIYYLMVFLTYDMNSDQDALFFTF